MRLRRLKAIAVKEVLQIWRDPRSLMIALLLPFTQMILLGYGVNLDLKHIPVCTFDREASQDSQALLKKLPRVDAISSIARNVRDYPELVAAIDRADCKIAVVIPPDFSERLADSRPRSVQAILDATDDNTANIAFGYAQAVVSAIPARCSSTSSRAQGHPLQQTQPMTVQSRVWFNEDLESRNFIIPGVVAIIMALVGAQLTSLTISREWERGTMELLISTPVKPSEVMFGKLVPYLVLGWIDAAFCLVIAALWFEVPFRGTLFTLFVTTTLFLVVVLGIGYLHLGPDPQPDRGEPDRAAGDDAADHAAVGLRVPDRPDAGRVQDVTYLIYSRYYVTIVKAIFLKGSGYSGAADADPVPHRLCGRRHVAGRPRLSKSLD